MTQEVKVMTMKTMKSGQLIEFNMRNIFFEKACTKCGRERSSESFFKKSKLSICFNQL